MNIHEHQAKKILSDFGAPISKGVVILKKDEIDNKLSLLQGDKFVIKAQIHAGGRGKAGGVKVVKKNKSLKKEIEDMFGKILVTHQTGPEGKEVKRVYVEEASDIEKEFYLSCLIDRETSKIAFISSTAGGMDIETIAKEDPKKILTTKIDLTDKLDIKDIEKILKPFNFNTEQKLEGTKVVNSMFEILIKKDASLIEINPLIITKNKKVICLDAKMNFDDNAMFRRPDILSLREEN